MSNLQKNTEVIFSKYLEKYSDENKSLNLLSEQIKDKEDLISRKNFRGHIATSGLVFFQNKILLIFHNKLQKYIQPGGHCDEEDVSILEVAKREVLEETDLQTEIYGEKFTEPLCIDSHKIPENKKKSEQEHFHHDFLFLLKPLNEKVLLDKTEISDYRWVNLDYDFKDKEIKNAVKKLLELIWIMVLEQEKSKNSGNTTEENSPIEKTGLLRKLAETTEEKIENEQIEQIPVMETSKNIPMTEIPIVRTLERAQKQKVKKILQMENLSPIET